MCVCVCVCLHVCVYVCVCVCVCQNHTKVGHPLDVFASWHLVRQASDGVLLQDTMFLEDAGISTEADAVTGFLREKMCV